MSLDLRQRCEDLLIELGLAKPGDTIVTQPLTGGVASDIAKVVLNNEQKFCIKFALAKLKVKADWFAPVHRNAAEYQWLQVAAKVAPESTVKLYGLSEVHHGFAMEFIEGKEAYLWKSELLSEAPDRGEAAKVGAFLGKIHAMSAKEDFDTAPFQNRDDFFDIRIEPYLIHTSLNNEDVAPQLTQMAKELFEEKKVLVHGDVSPKNILFRDGQPIILDAECATMGDPCFDCAFCLNHLVLKAVYLPESRDRYLRNMIDFWSAYSPCIEWEAVGDLEARLCRLLPALMLGRVDGKSPVEYLSADQQIIVRKVAKKHLITPCNELAVLVDGISRLLKEQE